MWTEYIEKDRQIYSVSFRTLDRAVEEDHLSQVFAPNEPLCSSSSSSCFPNSIPSSWGRWALKWKSSWNCLGEWSWDSYLLPFVPQSSYCSGASSSWDSVQLGILIQVLLTIRIMLTTGSRIQWFHCRRWLTTPASLSLSPGTCMKFCWWQFMQKTNTMITPYFCKCIMHWACKHEAMPDSVWLFQTWLVPEGKSSKSSYLSKEL